MKLTLHVWRQKSPQDPGAFEEYTADNLDPSMSFLELLDQVNDDLIKAGKEPIAFEHDCREGICGSCGQVINGIPHGPDHAATTCQVYLRSFQDGEHLWVEPWRAKAFPIMKDLIVDRSSFDRIIQSGGYVSVRTGSAPDANALPIGKVDAERAMDSAECIGCGACVAACKNASAMLFVGAKICHLADLPQGQPERAERVRKMLDTMDAEGFGSCTNTEECEAACPKEISVENIRRLNKEYLRASVKS